ncbi:terpenoid synthase [Microthyrium microscopicum]|uniref:Terpene synthase n=1 Tax=Microthyrium microscopicum TaxID=703497 RepID=A0A6A6URT1_9PEZI|nr:terpenoid synthase [Microthyrium microscopicum]
MPGIPHGDAVTVAGANVDGSVLNEEPAKSEKAAPNEFEEVVKLPDVFAYFANGDLKVHPDYDDCVLAAKKWLLKYTDEKTASYVISIDWCWYSAACVPEANFEGLRLVSDWGNCLFPFDDLFDDGLMDKDIDAGRDLIDSLLAYTRGQKWHKPKHPFAKAHDDIWDRLQQGSPSIAKRYAASIEASLNSVLETIIENVDGRLSTFEERVERAHTSAYSMPMCIMIQSVLGIELPEEVYSNPVFLKLERLARDVLIVQNDVLSYQKEQLDGANNNVISLLRAQGRSAQEAMDQCGTYLDQVYHDWYETRAKLPSFGKEVDDKVQDYIENVLLVSVRTNPHCTFRSKRYFGENGEQVRKTGCITVHSDKRLEQLLKKE